MELNNETSLRYPVVYNGEPLKIRGEMLRHHFHKHDNFLVIEYELDTRAWSSVFIKFDERVLKLLIPLYNQSRQSATGWTETKSRTWRVSLNGVFSDYTEAQIALMLWKKMSRYCD